MKNLILVTLFTLSSTAAFAGDLLTCSGKFDLVIRPTAVVTMDQGILSISEDQKTTLACKRTDLMHGYTCTETRAGEGKFVVEVMTSVRSHMISATVSKEQMFPLKPKKLAALDCVVPAN